MADTIKRDLVTSIAAKCGLSKEQTLEIVQAFLDSITDRLVQGDRVILRRFGVFEVVKSKRRHPTAERKGRPAIPTVARFKAGGQLRARLNPRAR